MFRVDSVVPLSVDIEGTSEKIKAGINDAVLIQLPSDLTFVKAVELNVKIPQEIASWRDSVAYSIYENLSPKPDASKIDYEGKRICVKTFPSRLSTTIYIPLSAENDLKDSPYAVKLPVIADSKNGSIFLRLQLVMKGIPDSIENAKFEISAKSVLSNEGILILKIKEPESKASSDVSSETAPSPFTVFIDESTLNIDEKGAILPTGEHHLSVISDFYRNEIRSFRIDQAKTTEIEIHLRDIAPTLRILAPENATVFLDENKLESAAIKEEIPIESGEHQVRFKIGDYEIIKSVSCQNGRSYTVNLSIDATVSESE